MNNLLYQMMIKNLQTFFNKSAVEEENEASFDAFVAAEVLSVALAKHPDRIIEDLVFKKEIQGDSN